MRHCLAAGRTGTECGMKLSAPTPAQPFPAQQPTTLAARVNQAPYLVDAGAARARVADWIASLPPQEGKALGTRLAEHPLVSKLLQSLSESSPFLWELVGREPGRLLALL